MLSPCSGLGVNSLMDSVGDGEGGKIWENDIETCIISCMKRGKKKKKYMAGFRPLNFTPFHQ